MGGGGGENPSPLSLFLYFFVYSLIIASYSANCSVCDCDDDNDYYHYDHRNSHHPLCDIDSCYYGYIGTKNDCNIAGSSLKERGSERERPTD